jgi:ABC-type multidrug transport system fused ATPase/permease subunit
MMIFRRIFRLLLPEERKTGVRVVLTVLCSAVLDFMGLAALLPVLYYLLDDGNNSHAALSFCILAISVILLKSVLSLFFSRYQHRYLLSFYKRLSFSLYSSYYRKGLLFIREKGSNKLGYEVNAICYAFSQSLLAPMLKMVGDCLLVFLVTVALLIYDGTTVLLLYAAFLPFMLLYFFGIRTRIKKYGKLELDAKREQARVVMDTYRGFTELEVSGAFPTLQEAFLEGMDKVSANRLKIDMVQKFPLFLSELSVIIGLTLLVVFSTGDVKMLIGVFAVGAFRLLPAMRGILSGWTQIQNVSTCLDTIEDGLKDDVPEDTVSENDKPIAFKKDLSIENLTYAYPDSGNVLDNFNCCIRKGEYVGFRGSSGVGKSTLFNLLIGLLKPSSGNICIDGIPLSVENRRSWLHHIGYVPQEVFIFNGTLAENIALGCKEIDRDRIKKILNKVSLDKWAESLTNDLDTVLGEAGGKLSGGQKQRIGIARALYKEADVLFLDEATSALDNQTEKEVNETLSQLKEFDQGLTILSIAHRESSLAYCDRIITLEDKE